MDKISAWTYKTRSGAILQQEKSVEQLSIVQWAIFVISVLDWNELETEADAGSLTNAGDLYILVYDFLPNEPPLQASSSPNMVYLTLV